jgi:hypothetical protein
MERLGARKEDTAEKLWSENHYKKLLFTHHERINVEKLRYKIMHRSRNGVA